MQKYKQKGALKVTGITVVVLILVVVVAILGYDQVTGTKAVQNLCYDSTGQAVACGSIPLSGISNNNPQSAPAVTNAVPIPVSDVQFKIREPYSLSWTAYSGTIRIFNQNDDLTNPNTGAVDTASISSGAASKTAWNVFKTDTPYKLVIDGGGTYYDTLVSPFVFKSSSYNPNKGSYTVSFGDQGNDRLTSSDYPNVLIGEKIGTWSLTNSNNGTGTTIAADGTGFNYSNAVGNGQFSIDIKFGNSAANTLIKNAVIHPQNDQSNALEGNEITALTIQHVSGTDFGLPANALNYVTNYVPIQLGNIKGGQTSQDTWTFSINEANAAANERLHLYFDDLGGYRNHDVMVANLGITASDDPLTFGT